MKRVASRPSLRAAERPEAIHRQARCKLVDCFTRCAGSAMTAGTVGSGSEASGEPVALDCHGRFAPWEESLGAYGIREVRASGAKQSRVYCAGRCGPGLPDSLGSLAMTMLIRTMNEEDPSAAVIAPLHRPRAKACRMKRVAFRPSLRAAERPEAIHRQARCKLVDCFTRCARVRNDGGDCGQRFRGKWRAGRAWIATVASLPGKKVWAAYGRHCEDPREGEGTKQSTHKHCAGWWIASPRHAGFAMTWWGGCKAARRRMRYAGCIE